MELAANAAGVDDERVASAFEHVNVGSDELVGIVASPMPQTLLR